MILCTSLPVFFVLFLANQPLFQIFNAQPIECIMVLAFFTSHFLYNYLLSILYACIFVDFSKRYFMEKTNYFSFLPPFLSRNDAFYPMNGHKYNAYILHSLWQFCHEFTLFRTEKKPKIKNKLLVRRNFADRRFWMFWAVLSLMPLKTR